MLRVVNEKKLSRREAFEQKVRQQTWERTTPDAAVWELIQKIDAQEWLDIGCSFPERLHKAGKKVTALDAQEQRLEVKTIQECFPYTSLPDGAFDAILCLDLIATLDEELHRLALSELARLLKPEGYLVCSTSLDTHTLSPGSHFKSLVKTEFQIVEERARYLRFGPFFEKMTEIFLKDSGCTHLTIVGKKKTLYT